MAPAIHRTLIPDEQTVMPDRQTLNLVPAYRIELDHFPSLKSRHDPSP
jgi:hypothetical protein